MAQPPTMQLNFTHPVAVDGLDEHVHGRDELGADLLDAALAEDLAVDAAAVLLNEVGPHGVLADRCGHTVALESGTGRDRTLEVGERSRGSLVEGGTAGATIGVDAVADGLDGISKDCDVCLMLPSTYEVGGDRESSAQAEDAEDGEKEQHDCGDLDGEGHGDGVG